MTKANLYPDKEQCELYQYLYDLNGYLVIEDVLSHEQVSYLNTVIDRTLDPLPEDIADAIRRRGDQLYGTYRFGAAGGSHGTGPGFLAFDKMLCDLMDHPVIMQIMRMQLGDCFRLDRIFGMRMTPGCPSGRLHSDYGASEPFATSEPGKHYPQPGFQALHGFAVAAINLTDAGPDTGGLCCIPGSHNSHFRLPQCIRSGDFNDVVICPEAPAGSITFFSEATTHGTMEWKARHERRSLLYKYCASQLTWSRARVLAPEGIELTHRQQRLLEEPAGAKWFFETLFPEEEPAAKASAT